MKKIRNISITAAGFIGLVPFLALAQNIQGIGDIFIELRRIINNGPFPVLIGLAVIYFFWGVGQFILKDAGNDKTREDGKKKMLWGIIALFIMISLFGILTFLGNVLGISVQGALPAVDPSVL